MNALIPASRLPELCPLGEAGERTLETSVRRLGLSARAHDWIFKVARTFADLSAREIQSKHVAEALQYLGVESGVPQAQRPDGGQRPFAVQQLKPRSGIRRVPRH